MPQVLEIGSLLDHGKYRVERVLGEGGFGITYLVTDLGLDKLRAVKEFFPKDYCERDETTSQVTLGTTNTSELVNRLKAKFIKEARNIANLDQHDGIIRIHSVFEENNTAYYVMDYIDGESLSSIVKRSGPMPVDKAVRHIRQVGNALEYVHSHRINHLDVKPANIMIRRKDDKAILIDFGLAKQYDTAGLQTSTTPTGISHGFAPIEQYNAGGVSEFSPQTDIYSLAATLYYLLTATVPPQAPSLAAGELTFPSTIPQYLVKAISKAMSTRRNDRHETIEQFLEEIETQTISDNVKSDDSATEIIAEPESIQNPSDVINSKLPSTPDSAPKPTPKSNRKWYVIGAVAVIVIALSLLGVFIANQSNSSQPPKQASNAAIPAKPINPTTGTENGHEWVDLGLPSGIKWATCNVGASSPSDYGDYFAWGETSAKSSYVESNSKTYGKNIGDISGNPNYDAARANWGGNWRLPTHAECQELIDRCEWVWVAPEGVKGYKVTGPNGNYIFLPAAGTRYGTNLGRVGADGIYWSGTPRESDTVYAYYLWLNQVSHYGWGGRCYGCSIRPVAE